MAGTTQPSRYPDGTRASHISIRDWASSELQLGRELRTFDDWVALDDILSPVTDAPARHSQPVTVAGVAGTRLEETYIEGSYLPATHFPTPVFRVSTFFLIGDRFFQVSTTPNLDAGGEILRVYEQVLDSIEVRLTE
jgi:hypothetical protein